nr:MAG TPA: hypothetical protein [Caudoviricetes sp.]
MNIVDNKININDIYLRKRKLSTEKVFIDVKYDEIVNILDSKVNVLNRLNKLLDSATPESYITVLSLFGLPEYTECNRLCSSFITNKFKNDCIVYYHDLEEIENLLANSDVDIEKRDIISRVLSYLSNIDRLSFNHDSIMNRFNLYNLFDQFTRSYDILITLCNYIDTYNYTDLIKVKLAIDEFFILNNFNEKISIDETEASIAIFLYFFFKKNKKCDLDIESINDHISKYTKNVDKFNILFELRRMNIDIKDYSSIEEIIEDMHRKLNNAKTIANYIKCIYIYKYANDPNLNIEDVNKIDIFTQSMYTVSEYNNIKEGIEMMKDKINTSCIENQTADRTRFFYESEDYTKANIDIGIKPDVRVSDIAEIIRSCELVKRYVEQHCKTMVKEPLVFYDTYKDLHISNYFGHIDAAGKISFNIAIGQIYFDRDMLPVVENLRKALENILYNTNCFPIVEVLDTDLLISVITKYEVNTTDQESVIGEEIVRVFNILKDHEKDLDAYMRDMHSRVDSILYVLNNDSQIAKTIGKREFVNLNDIITKVYGDNKNLQQFVDSVKYHQNPNAKFIEELYNLDKGEDEKLDLNVTNYEEAVNILEQLVMNRSKTQPLNENVINTLQLAWQDFKGKVKKLSAKEQEMSRDMDMNFNNFVRSMKNSLSGNRREAIIRDQLCPSLSKMIKIGIPVAATAIINPIIPAISALSWMVLSKVATDKEVAFILDEFDIELKVLDREIQKAEQGGSPQKYRKLLTIQKKLMREKQKIQYKYALSGKRIKMVSNYKPQGE